MTEAATIAFVPAQALPTKTPDELNVDQLYLEVLYCICYEPGAIDKFLRMGVTHPQIRHPTAGPIYEAAARLRNAKPPIVADRATISGTGVATLDELDNWAFFCTADMLDRITGTATVIQNAAMLAALEDTALDLLQAARTGKIFDAERIALKFEQQLARLRSHVRPEITSGVGIGDIYKRVKNNPKASVPPFLTGIPWMDNITNGGIRAKTVHSIGGPMKQGKTTLARMIAMSQALLGYRVVHIAHDGGDDEEHFYTYAAMMAQKQAMAMNAQTTVKLPNGRVEHIITPEVMEYYITGQLNKIAFQIPPATRQAIDDAARVWDTWSASDTSTPGYIHIYDAPKIRGNVDWLISILEREYEENGAQMVIIDHLLKLADPTDFSKSVPATIYKLTEFINTHFMGAIILSQVTDETMKNRDSDKAQYRAGLKFAVDLEAESHFVWSTEIKEDQPNELGVWLQLSRKAAQGVSTKKIFQRHPPSGFLWW